MEQYCPVVQGLGPVCVCVCVCVHSFLALVQSMVRNVTVAIRECWDVNNCLRLGVIAHPETHANTPPPIILSHRQTISKSC